MAFKAKMLGREQTMRLLNKVVPEVETKLAAAQMDCAETLATKIKPRAPGPRTGAYMASIQADKLSNRPKERALGGRGIQNETKDPTATGVFADYIWRFHEFGTIHMTKRPHIFPTYRQERPNIRSKLAAAVRKGIRQAKG